MPTTLQQWARSAARRETPDGIWLWLMQQDREEKRMDTRALDRYLSQSDEEQLDHGEEEETEFDEPEEGDYTTSDYQKFYQYGKLVAEVNEEQDWRDIVGEHMDTQKFWPNVWVISDHGNAHLLSLTDD